LDVDHARCGSFDCWFDVLYQVRYRLFSGARLGIRGDFGPLAEPDAIKYCRLYSGRVGFAHITAQSYIAVYKKAA
jgi:hypothetical protein